MKVDIGLAMYGTGLDWTLGAQYSIDIEWILDTWIIMLETGTGPLDTQTGPQCVGCLRCRRWPHGRRMIERILKITPAVRWVPQYASNAGS